MEDYDDCLPVPDKEGRLDLRYRGWNHLDDTLWTMGKELISLTVAFNSLEELPPDVGNLHMLKYLDVSCNKLTELPPEMGKLKRLVSLKCSGNKLKFLPEELAKCTLLEELVVSENELVKVPEALATLPALRILRLQQNRLRSFPVAIGVLPTLVVLDLSFNPALTKDFPEEWLSNTEQLAWFCQVHQRYLDQMAVLQTTNKELEAMTMHTKEMKLRLQDQMRELTEENRRLVSERPVNYLILKDAARRMQNDVRYHVDLISKSRACVIS